MNKFKFDDRDIPFEEGMTVAAALLQAGIYSFRETQASSSPRGPFCMMGTCYDCLLEIDGTPNLQGCQVQAVTGMKVNTQRAFYIPEEV